MKHIILIRHGETAWNAAGRIQGATDVPLNETGRQQAALAAASLAGWTWDRIWASPLSRAADTARIIAASIGFSEADIRYDDRLVERNFGAAEGLSHDERRERWPDRSDIPGVEEWSDVAERGAQFLTEMVNGTDAERIVIAAHGGLIKSTLTEVTHGAFSDIRALVYNGGLTYLTWDGEWTLEWFNRAPGEPLQRHELRLIA